MSSALSYAGHVVLELDTGNKQGHLRVDSGLYGPLKLSAQSKFGEWCAGLDGQRIMTSIRWRQPFQRDQQQRERNVLLVCSLSGAVRYEEPA